MSSTNGTEPGTNGQRRVVVVYESMFGNTAAVASTIAAELAAAGAAVEVAEVSAAPPAHELEADLVVLGAPTHAFSLSRPGTREDAVRQGAPAQRAATGIREWLADARLNPPPRPLPVAAFDTRVSRVRRLPGSAARKIRHLAGPAGLDPVLGVESFYVNDVSGPLDGGELDRAREWVHALTTQVTTGPGRR